MYTAEEARLIAGLIIVERERKEGSTVGENPIGQVITGRLSAVARAITGTAWSGPRFFALQRAGHDSGKSSAALEDSRRQRGAALATRRRHRRVMPVEAVADASLWTSFSPQELSLLFCCVSKRHR